MITVEALSHTYGAGLALDDVTLGIEGGVTALVGVNGAGKSTLMSVLATLLQPTGGSVHFGDGSRWPSRSLRQTRFVRQQVGLSPQTGSLPAQTTVRDLLHYVAHLRGVRRSERESAVAGVLEMVNLTGQARSRCGHLSGGMRKRVLVAQALLHAPELVLLDEPMESLDPEQRISIRGIVSEIAASERRSVIISSHVLADVVPIADRIVMLDEGRVIFDGSVEELEGRGRSLAGPASGLSPCEAAFLALRRGGEVDADHA